MISLLLLAMALDAPKADQQNTKPEMHARELLPESVPKGSCSLGYSGYLMFTANGKDEYLKLTPEQVGKYVMDEAKKGYVLTIAPQESGRLFVMAQCGAPAH